MDKQIKAYATKIPGKDTYEVVYVGGDRGCRIPVFESSNGEKRLREHFTTISEDLEKGLEFVVINIEPLVDSGLVDEEKLHNFH